MRDILCFLSLEHLETIIWFNWPNFDIAVSQGLRRPEVVVGVEWLVGRAVKTHAKSIDSACGSSKQSQQQHQRSPITDIMTNLDILGELPKLDRETRSERMLLYKNDTGRSASGRVATNCPFVTNTVFVKYNKVKHNKMKYACIVMLQLDRKLL